MRVRRLALLSAALPFVPARATAQLPEEVPYTVPEATAWRRTSTCEEVRSFLTELGRLPHADRLVVASMGTSHEGRDLPIVLTGVSRPEAALAGDRVRVLVNANIHGGEVEGKEAVLILLREIAGGRHAALLERVAVVFVPVYNADGNDRIARENRVSQNGPDGGVGQRANAQGLDLNRDFVKAESPECRALLALLTRWDPHVFLDLHTTNGSRHGYHLTYAPSLSTGIDPALDAFGRDELLPAVRTAMLDGAGFRVFDYGNFTRGGVRQWVTYDHRPRFGTNYVGLRNRIGLLSEAYSYLPFRERVEVTRSFVLEVLRAVAERSGRLRSACAAADARVEAGAGVELGLDGVLAEGSAGPVLVGSVREVELEGLGVRRVAEPAWHPEEMVVRDRFAASTTRSLPVAWAIPEPDDGLRETLRHHGLWLVELTAPATARVEAFAPTVVRRARREFQGHHEITLEGGWSAEDRTLPVGTLVVSARQPLGRLAAWLLEPESADSLSTWNLMEGGTRAAEGAERGCYPVLRVLEEVELQCVRVPAYGTPGY